MSVKGIFEARNWASYAFFLVCCALINAEDKKTLELEVYGSHKLPKTTEALKGGETLTEDEVKKTEGEILDEWTKKERETQPVAYGPKTARMSYRSRYPDFELAMQNLMDPIPVPNNPQVYPFMMTVPFEGGDVLPPKHLELTITNTVIEGELVGRSPRYQIDMDNEYFQQTFGISMGLAGDVEMGISIPLYHLEGDLFFTQDGISGIGPIGASRNFWGGATLRIKAKVLKSHNQDEGTDVLLAGYFQFPEGNQRAQGGTSSGHWAINSIMEKRWLRQRLHMNLGVTQPGTLRLDNGVDLQQDMGYFFGLGLSHKLTPTSAVEGQFHLNKSALGETQISDLDRVQMTVALGYRKQIKKSLDASLSVLKGIDSAIDQGFSLDLRYFW